MQFQDDARPAWNSLRARLLECLGDPLIVQQQHVYDFINILVHLVIAEATGARDVFQILSPLNVVLQKRRSSAPRTKKSPGREELLKFRERWMAENRRDSDRGWKKVAKLHFGISDRTLNARFEEQP